MTIQEARGASALTTIGTANFHRAMMPTRRCAKALKPMADLSALKEQTWRTASFWHISYLKNAGATNKRIPWGEQVSDFVTNVRQSEVQERWVKEKESEGTADVRRVFEKLRSLVQHSAKRKQ